jgi:hypothetical protein
VRSLYARKTDPVSNSAVAGHGAGAENPSASGSPWTRRTARSTLLGMITRDSIDAMIRECSMHEEHLGARLADAERDAPERTTSLVDLIDTVRRLKAQLVQPIRRG